MTRLQRPHRIDGETRAEPPLGVGDPNPWISGESSRRRQALRERRHATGRLQRILGRDQPPNLVQPQALERQGSDVKMTGVGRIERTAQQSDASASFHGRL